MLRKPSSPLSRTSSHSPPAWLRVLELTIEAAKVLVWPIFALAILIVFISPIERIASGLATKLEMADKVSFGSLSLEIVEKAREAGSPDLAAQIGKLTPAAIEQLLLTPRTGDVVLPSTVGANLLVIPKKKQLDALTELSNQGFIQFNEDISNYLADLRRHQIDRSSKSVDRDFYIVPGGLGSPTIERFRDLRYSMTEKGRIAGDAVVKAVTAQLGK